MFSILNTGPVDDHQPNDASHWRDFERNLVTHSMAHYLTAVHALHRSTGYARATDVADFLNVSRGAASMALAQLKKRQWITEDESRYLYLSERGMFIAKQVERNFRVLSQFFEHVLGAAPEVASSDACKMEHLLSMETGQRLIWFMEHLLSNEEQTSDIRSLMNDFEPDRIPANGWPAEKEGTPAGVEVSHND